MTGQGWALRGGAPEAVDPAADQACRKHTGSRLPLDDRVVPGWNCPSECDLDTADAMLRAGRYLYVGFMCHQGMEKALKARFQAARGEVPPRTHNLRLLLELSGLGPTVTAQQRKVVLGLEPLNMETRYPESRERRERLPDQERCVRLLAKTRELQRWIKRKL